MAKYYVIDLKNPEPFINDPITDILCNGARELLAQALEVEIASFLSQYVDLRDDHGRKRITRNGYLPEREIQTGIGQVSVKMHRFRDRHSWNALDRIRFNSSILPPYLRKTKSIETLIPWLYLKGISTGDFTDVLADLVGKDAPRLSPSTIGDLCTTPLKSIDLINFYKIFRISSIEICFEDYPVTHLVFRFIYVFTRLRSKNSTPV